MFPNPIAWGFDQAFGWANGAVDELSSSIFGGLASWILSAIPPLMETVYRIVFANPDIGEGAWFTAVFRDVRTQAAGLLLAVLFYGVARAALSGNPGLVLRRFAVDGPKAILLGVFVVQVVGLGMAVADEISERIIGGAGTANTEAFFEGFGVILDVVEGGEGAAAFIFVLLGIAMLGAGLGLWILMLLRSAAIYILVALAPLVAIGMVTNYRDSIQKLIRLLLALIFSKIVIVLTLTMGLSAVVNVPFVAAGLDPATVVAEPPAGPGEEVGAVVDVDDEAAGGLGTAVAYQLIVGLVVMVLALFSPMVVMQLIPDGVEQYHLYSSAQRGVSRVRGAPIRTARRAKPVAVRAAGLKR